jgi:hypothetical protein
VGDEPSMDLIAWLDDVVQSADNQPAEQSGGATENQPGPSIEQPTASTSRSACSRCNGTGCYRCEASQKCIGCGSYRTLREGLFDADSSVCRACTNKKKCSKQTALNDAVQEVTLPVSAEDVDVDEYVTANESTITDIVEEAVNEHK